MFQIINVIWEIEVLKVKKGLSVKNAQAIMVFVRKKALRNGR